MWAILTSQTDFLHSSTACVCYYLTTSVNQTKSKSIMTYKKTQKNISIKCTGCISLESILMTQCETVFPQCFGPSKHNSINSEKHVINHRWTCIFYLLKSPVFPLKVKQQMLMLGATIGFLNTLRSLALSFLTTHSQTKINCLFHSSFILCLYKRNERALNWPWWGKPMPHTDLTINTPEAQIHWQNSRLYLPNEGERSPPHIYAYTFGHVPEQRTTASPLSLH